jgi:hypothetical protein
LEWRWGQLGPLAYQAVDKAVRADIAKEQARKMPKEDSTSASAITITGIRAGFSAFVQHLQQRGIGAIEAAVSRKGR